MRVPSGSYRPPTQSGEIEKNRQKIDVLSRRQQRAPKVPPPPAAAGPGGAKGYTRAVPNAITQAGNAYMCSNWDFDSTWSNWGWADPTLPPQLIQWQWGSILGSAHMFAPVAAGWFWQRVSIDTDSTASRLHAVVNDTAGYQGIDPTSYLNDVEVSKSITGSGFRHSWTFGPFWLPAYDNSSNGPFRLFFQYPAGETPTHSFLNVNTDIIAVGL